MLNYKHDKRKTMLDGDNVWSLSKTKFSNIYIYDIVIVSYIYSVALYAVCCLL